MTQLLNSAPRELVLILKTNDLLRGLEHTLGSSIHSRSFLTMSKYCVLAVGEWEEGRVKQWHQKLIIRIQTRLRLLLIRLYEMWVWFRYSLV